MRKNKAGSRKRACNDDSRPVPEQDFGNDLVPVHIGVVPVPGVPGFVPVVAQTEVGVFRDREGHLRFHYHGFPDVGLLQGLRGIIQEHMAAADRDCVAGETDDPLHEEDLLVVRPAEDDDIAALRIPEELVLQTGADDAVPGHDGVLHGRGGDSRVGNDETVHKKSDQGRADDDLDPADDLRFQAGFLLFGARSCFLIFHKHQTSFFNLTDFDHS